MIVADPPRKGLDEATIHAIAAMEPAKMVYVSCDPATLARDVKQFAESGYQLERVRAFDLFPRTRHVETIVLLQRENS